MKKLFQIKLVSGEEIIAEKNGVESNHFITVKNPLLVQRIAMGQNYSQVVYTLKGWCLGQYENEPDSNGRQPDFSFVLSDTGITGMGVVRNALLVQQYEATLDYLMKEENQNHSWNTLNEDDYYDSDEFEGDSDDPFSNIIPFSGKGRLN